ncbi:MAG TPA: DUF421 domain-containing protein, partial [Bacillales bacterium]|nr:DUF421 domain-containing protein [Bacillales bacterium]
LLVFLFGYLLLRITGKKAVSQMTSLDLLFVLVVGTVIAEPIVSSNLWKAAYYGIVVVAAYLFFSHLVLNNKFRWFLMDSPTVLVRNGDIDEKGLKKVRMTTSELIAQLRAKGHTNIKDVEMCTMEDVGIISVVPKSYARPVEPQDIQLKTKPTYIPIPVIMNGQYLDHNLKYLNKDRGWLEQEIANSTTPVSDIGDITLATINEQGKVDIDTDNPTENDKGPYVYKPGQDN